MKKLFILISILCLLLFTVSCGDNKASSVYAIDDFSLYNAETKSSISLGMSKSEIENALNDTFVRKEMSLGLEEIAGIMVGFRNDMAVLFMLSASDEAAKGYVTKRGVSVDSSESDFLKKYPTAIQFQGGNQNSVFLLKENDNYKDISSEYNTKSLSFSNQYDTSLIYQIYFGSNNSSKNPNSLYIGDFKAIKFSDYGK